MTPELEAVIRQEQDYLASLDATIAKERPIRRDKVAIPLTNRWISVRYEVVELDELVTSDMPGFDPALQPRDRTQQESAKQVQEIVDIFDPYQLLANPHTDRGAPILGYANNMVESGNGRVMALRKITPEQMAEYRKALGEFLGYEVEGKVPILVRRRDEAMSKAELVEYTRKSNRPTGAEFDSRRNAEMVGEKVPLSVLNMYQGGGLKKPANAAFVREWLSYADKNQLSGYSTGGVLSERGAHEIHLWLLSKAYKDVLGGEKLLDDIALSYKQTNTDVGYLLNMMRDVAGDVALLRHTVAGSKFQELDIAADLVYAVNVVNRARTEPNMSIQKILKTEDFLGTRTPEIEALIDLMQHPIGVVREVVEDYIERAMREGLQAGPDILGEIISKEKLLNAAKGDIPAPTPGKGGKKAKGKTAGGGDGEAQAKASQEAEGPIQPVAKTQATEDEIFLQAEVSAQVQKYIQADIPDNPFVTNLGKGFSYFERGQKVMDDMFGTADVRPVENAPLNSVAGRANTPPPGKADSEEAAMKNVGDDPNVQNAKKMADVVSKCDR
jgi:hypothetical protein